MSDTSENRFVILEHDWPFLHWDLMLEDAGRLLTWRILSQPVLNHELQIEASPDHRLAYLDYTGSVSGGRGVVKSWDRGSLTSLEINQRRLLATIKSDKFNGLVSISIEHETLILEKQY